MQAALRFTETGKITLRRLHIDVQRQIKKELKRLPRSPEKGKPLTGRLDGFWSLRIGNHRAIYSVDGETVVVHRVGHRKNVYKDTVEQLRTEP